IGQYEMRGAGVRRGDGGAAHQRSASGDGRDYGQLVTVFDRRLQVAEEADVVAVQVEVDEAPDTAFFVAQPLLDAAVLAFEVVDPGAARRAGGATLLGAAGEAAQGRRYANVNGHVGFLLIGR